MSIAFFLLLIAIVLSSTFDASQGTSLSATERDVTWENFKVKFTKTYASAAEESNRKATFNDRLSAISAHNNDPSSTYKMAVNQFTDRTIGELKAYTGVIQPKQNGFKTVFDNIAASPSALVLPKKNLVSLPASVDFRNDSCMQPIKDQAKCGACWAFVAVNAIEFNSCVQTGKAVALSDQEVTDCTYASSRDGCQGGYPSDAFIAIASKTFGINTDASYPYTSGKSKKSGTCKHQATENGATVQLLFPLVQMSSSPVSNIMYTLANKGLVTVCFFVIKSFFSYKSGVYDTKAACNFKSNEGAHAITIVGYGTDNATGLEYWICRNQWSANWGLSGYVLFRRGVDLCEIESWAPIGVNTGGFLASILSNIG